MDLLRKKPQRFAKRGAGGMTALGHSTMGLFALD